VNKRLKYYASEERSDGIMLDPIPLITVTEDRRDPETGKFSSSFSDEALLDAVSQNEPVGTTDLAQMFDCTQQAAYQRLVALEDDEKIESKLIGGARVWMVD
jgi:predicted HTH transcriptional regulator